MRISELPINNNVVELWTRDNTREIGGNAIVEADGADNGARYELFSPT